MPDAPLVTLLTLGFGIFFTAQFARALPWKETWRYMKPLSCNACMTGWAAIAWSGLDWRACLENAPLLAGAAGISYLLMALNDALTARSWGPPPT